MRVLVTWGSKHGETAEIAEKLAITLEKHGHEVVAMPISNAPSPYGFEAAIVGSEVYANRWERDARRYVERYLPQLRRIPVWLFSTGELDQETRELRALLARTGAVDHVIFGDDIDANAEAIAHDLRDVQPRAAEELHGHSLHRIVEYGAVAWAASAAPLFVHALIMSTILGGLVFGVLAHRYQSETGARSPLAIAAIWAVFAGVLDALFFRSLAVAIPVGFGFAAAWAVGAITAMTPLPKPRTS